jgi:hypothetical protein
MQNTGLFLIKTGDPAAGDHHVEDYLERWVRYELADFTNHLEIARFFWRHYRELVEAPEFPDHLRAAYLEVNGHEPDDGSVDYGWRGSPGRISRDPKTCTY